MRLSDDIVPNIQPGLHCGETVSRLTGLAIGEITC
jgi:hypothetical protein